MKIAFIQQPGVMSFPPRGSLPVWVQEVAQRLAGKHSVVVFSGRGRSESRQRDYGGVSYRLVWQGLDERIARWAERILRAFRIRTSLPWFATSGYYVTYVLATGVMLKRWKPDVVHVMNYSQFVGALRAFVPGARFVLHMHCEWLSQLDTDLMRSRLKRTDLVLGCSRHVTGRAAREFGDLDTRFATVHNGTYLSLDNARPRDSEVLRLLYVGRLSPEKGIHLLLEAMAMLNRQDIRLELVGPSGSATYPSIVALSDDPLTASLARFYGSNGDDRYGPEISSLADRLEPGQVTFTGALPYEEVRKRYGRADIFVYPSVWNEPFGMPVVEAMAAGLPVVTTKAGGLAEIVDDGETGLLVERGSAEALARAIIRLADNAELRQRLGKQALSVSTRYSWDSVATELEVLLSELIRSSSDRRTHG